MLTKLYSPAKRADGFTLLELLVVVVVIGILAAIALPVFLNNQRAAIDAAVKSDVRNTTGQVVGWRATHNGTLPASAAEYINGGGRMTTTTGTYMNVVFSSTDSYTVCGYNHGGLKFADYQHSWMFDSTTGHFTANSGAECVNALNYTPPGGDASATPDPGADPTNPPNTTKDPDGKYTGDPGDGGTGDPGTGPGTPPGGSGTTPATCPAPDDSAVTLTKPTSRLAYAKALYLSSTRLSIDQNRPVSAQQAKDMKDVSDWVADYASKHLGDTVDNSYVEGMANEAYYGSTSIGVYFYNIDEEVGSNAAANVNVYDFNDGYSWHMSIGSNPSQFLAEWDYDVNPSTTTTGNGLNVESRPAILNTDGNQTEGYLHVVTGAQNWREYTPKCGAEQQFSGSGEVTPTDPPTSCVSGGTCEQPPGDGCTSNCDPDPGTGGSSNALNVDTGSWLYSFDGPTASDEVTKKGDYPSMCWFDVNDPANAQKWPSGNEVCQAITQDGTDNPEFGTQLIRTAELSGDDFPTNGKLDVTGDFNFLNGQYHCAAGDGVHVLSENGLINTTQIQPYGPYSGGGRYYYRGGTNVGGEEDVLDFWTVSTYEQCDTTTKTARVAILITYPEDITHARGANGGGHTVGGAVFNYQGYQYRISTSGYTRFNRDDIFDRTSRAPVFYTPNTYHGEHLYISCDIPASQRELAACQ